MIHRIITFIISSCLSFSLFATQEIQESSLQSQHPIQPLTQKQIGAMATQYFMDHPHEMLKVLQNLHNSIQKNKEDKIKKVLIENKELLLQSSYLPILGNPNATKTLIYFYDFQCIYCKKKYPLLIQLLKTNKDLKIVFVPLHLFGKVSSYTNKMALYINSLGKFKQFYDSLEANKEKLTVIAVNNIAKNLGVNIGEAKKYINSVGLIKAIESIDKLKNSLDIHGTPYIFIIPSDESSLSNTTITIFKGYVEKNKIQQVLNSISS